MGEIKVGSAVVVPPSLLSPDVAKEQIATFMGHAYSMLEHLKQQNINAGLTAEKANQIYEDAKKELQKLQEKLEKNIDRMTQAKESAKSLPISDNLFASQIQSQLEQTKKELKQHKESVKTLSAEVEKIQREHDKLKKAIDNFPKVMEAPSQEQSILSKKLAALTEKEAELSKELERLKEAHDQESVHTHTSEARVTRLEKQLEIANLEKKLEEANRVEQQKRSALQGQVQPVELKAVGLSSDIEQLKKTLREEERSVEVNRKELQDVEAKSALISGEVSKLEKKVRELESKKLDKRDENWEKEINQARVALQEKESQKLKLQSRSKELRTHLARSQEEITKLKQSLKERTREKAQHDLALSNLKAKEEALAQKYLQSQKEVKSLESQLAASKKELEFFETNLSKENLHKIKGQLKDAEKEIAKIIQQTQLRSVSAIGEQKETGTASRVEALAKGGWGARKVRLLSALSSIDRKAVKAFQQAQKAMREASKKEFEPISNESHVDQDRRAEFELYRTGKGSLDHRAGVIGLNGIYQIEASFSKDKIKKQFESFKAQHLSDKERPSITRNVQIGEDTFTNEFIPLNGEFDKAIEKRGNLPTLSAFSNIFGSKGISSANRKEAHLVNGWESTLKSGDKVIFRALRHGITSDKVLGTFFGISTAVKSLVSRLLGKGITMTRQQRARVAAAELLEAAILEEIASQGLTLEQAQKQGITLNFNSVSLVTPDSLRGLAPEGLKQANEKEMLLYQALALNGYDVSQSGQLDFKLKEGISIPIKAHVNTFNFGVNEGAVNWKLGFGEQYELNKKAMEGFVPQVQNFSKQVETELAKEREKLEEMNQQLREKSTVALQKEDSDPIWAELETLKQQVARLQQRVKDHEMGLENAKQLLQDIQQMMANKNAYIEGGNQYEIGAKILNLSNVMDDTISSINEDRNPSERLPGYKCAFNCMSGKDRTGFMDGVAKTLAIMAKKHGGHYPAHKEFMENPALQKEFVDILVPLLIEGGTLEITKLETGFMGLKVQEEARIFGMELTDFLQIQGYSVMTSA
jgi:myosin heavy subunit